MAQADLADSLLGWRRSAKVGKLHLTIAVARLPESNAAPVVTVHESGRDIYADLDYPSSVYVPFPSARRSAAIVQSAALTTIGALPEERRLGMPSAPAMPCSRSTLSAARLVVRAPVGPGLTETVMALSERLDDWGAGIVTEVTAHGGEATIECRGQDAERIAAAVRGDAPPPLTDTERWPTLDPPIVVPPSGEDPIMVLVWVPVDDGRRWLLEDEHAEELVLRLDAALGDLGTTDVPEFEHDRVGFFLCGTDPDVLLATADPVLRAADVLPATAEITDARDRTGTNVTRPLT